MAKEQLTWHQQLNQIKPELSPQQERDQRRMDHETDRLGYEIRFEEALNNLVDDSKILGWKPSKSEDRFRGTHYWIQTEQGCVPFGIAGTHRKAQLKRQMREEIRYTTITLITQHMGFLKSPRFLAKQILQSIDAYWENTDTISNNSA